MSKIADLDKIATLLQTEAGYRIAKDTGISQSTISRFQTGESKIENMRLIHAIKLTEYYDEKKGAAKLPYQ